MKDTLTPDICVIGAGSGGLSVAAIAAAFGVSVVLLEKGKMGGDCLNYGCVPSKAMIAAGKTAQTFRDAGPFGIKAQEPEINFRKVHDHVHDVIATIEPNDSIERFTALGVHVINEAGQFVDAHTLKAGKTTIKARRYVIATGSSAFVPPIPGIDKVDYLTNETLFDNTRKISKLVIIGGGPIGMEMAQAHRRLGSEVTVIEGVKAFGKDDPEMSVIVLEKLRAEGIEILEQTKVTAVEKRGKSGVRLICEHGGETVQIDGTHLLVAAGRKPNLDGLGLDKAGIETGRAGVSVTKDLRTTNKRVYAIGDAAGGPQFTHVAGYHAGLVIQGILFRKKAVPDYSALPMVTFTDPELAQVGLTEMQAREMHKNVHVYRWPYHENDRAIAERKTTGHIKLVTGKKGIILGVSIVGANAGEMINMWALALSQKTRLGDVRNFISPYPTMSEIGKRAAVSSYAPLARKPLIRKIIGFLAKFG